MIPFSTILRLEETSLSAWPAIEEEEFDGWRLRASEGFTKRANSVQPFAGSTLPLEGRISYCESWYRSRDLPCIFRLTPVSEPPLQRRLSDAGYRTFDPTAVLERPLSRPTVARAGDRCRVATLPDWLDAFALLSEMTGGPPPALRRILERGLDQRFLAVLGRPDGGEPIACGMATLDGEWVGLFDLVTSARHRRRGHGTAVVGALLSWGARHGARRAYLQVAHENEGARGLYQRMGFRHVYDYSYWAREG